MEEQQALSAGVPTVQKFVHSLNLRPPAHYPRARSEQSFMSKDPNEKGDHSFALGLMRAPFFFAQGHP